MSDLRQRAIDLYDAFTHEHRDRRLLLRQMAALAGSVAAAEVLIAGIAASPVAAAITKSTDPRLLIRRVRGTQAKHPAAAYSARPKAATKPLATVVVLHENRGLTPHIEDVTRRIALEGFNAVAPDLLAPQGGTPSDEDRGRAMIEAIDYDLAIAQVLATLKHARGQGDTRGTAGVLGFCWGGALVNRVAIAAGDGLDAGVAYYGPAPDPAEAQKVSAPLLLHYAGLDARVAATAKPWVAALKAAGKPVTAFTYPGVNHAFNNDTAADRYSPAAAKLAWGRTTEFLHRQLDG